MIQEMSSFRLYIPGDRPDLSCQPNPYSAETNGFVLSDTIWTFNMAATTAKDSFNENAENTVAVTKDNFALKAYI